MSEILSNNIEVIRSKTPEDRSSYTESGNPADSIPLFSVGNTAWLSVPRQGNFEFTIAARKKEGGVYKYQVKDPNSGALYKEGGWFRQDKLSSS